MLRRFASVLIGVLAAGMFLVAGPTNAFAQAQFFQWDIVNVLSGSPLPGGVASAFANDNSKITLTSTGTFLAPPSGARFTALIKSGSGTWETFARSTTSSGPGASTGSGTYRALIGPAAAWKQVGTFPGTDGRGGLLVLDIVYSDGDRGVLVVSCRGAVGAPAGQFEGVTATKGVVDYWARQAPRAGVEGNRTLFTSIPRP